MNFVKKFSYSLALICLMKIVNANFDIKKEDNNIKTYNVPNVGIIGGHEATPGMFPFMVSLFSKHGPYCGGSLISDRFVLTAAHCANSSSEMLVLAGVHIFKESKMKRYQPIGVKEVIIHPRFRRVDVRNDIALIKLAKPVEFKVFEDGFGNSAKIELENKAVPVGSDVIASGWGVFDLSESSLSRVLKYGNYKIIDIRNCPKAENIDGGLSTFCVGTGQGTDSPCHGDSGGPLIRVDAETKKVKLIGITSYLSNFNFSGKKKTWKNVVFTKVSNYIDWIEFHTGPLSMNTQNYTSSSFQESIK